MFLDGEEYLFRIYWFYKVVAYLASKRLVHYMLLFALGNHDYRQRWIAIFNLSEGVKAAESRHVLVKKHYVNVLVGKFVDSLVATGDGYHVVVALFEKKYMWLEEVYLVIGP